MSAETQPRTAPAQGQTAFPEIPLEQWVATAERHRAEGYRLVQMTGTARPDCIEIMISFAQERACANYRTFLPRDCPQLPSLSGVFLAAFTYENELKDLFGIAVPGLAVDYGGNFLRTKVKVPFSGDVVLKPASAPAKAEV